MENKEAALHALELALVDYSRENILSLSLIDDKERVLITYDNGYSKSVNIACDSVCAMIRDVMSHIGV